MRQDDGHPESLHPQLGDGPLPGIEVIDPIQKLPPGIHTMFFAGGRSVETGERTWSQFVRRSVVALVNSVSVVGDVGISNVLRRRCGILPFGRAQNTEIKRSSNSRFALREQKLKHGYQRRYVRRRRCPDGRAVHLGITMNKKYCAFQ